MCDITHGLVSQCPHRVAVYIFRNDVEPYDAIAAWLESQSCPQCWPSDQRIGQPGHAAGFPSRTQSSWRRKRTCRRRVGELSSATCAIEIPTARVCAIYVSLRVRAGVFV